MTKYQVALGEEFEISSVEVSGNPPGKSDPVSLEHRKLSMRDKLSVTIIVILGASLLIATLIGMHDGSYDEVAAVWAAGAAPLGFILRAYFDN